MRYRVFLSLLLVLVPNRAHANIPCVLGDIYEEHGAYYLVDEGPDGFLCTPLNLGDAQGLSPNPTCGPVCRGKAAPRVVTATAEPKPVFEPLVPGAYAPIDMPEFLDEESESILDP